MAYRIYKNSDVTSAYVKEYIADERTDIAELPVDDAPGSSCIVLKDSSVWMLGNDETWHEI
jgi:hypothetical protein